MPVAGAAVGLAMAEAGKQAGRRVGVSRDGAVMGTAQGDRRAAERWEVSRPSSR